MKTVISRPGPHSSEHSGNLRELLQTGKKIIITTIQKFPFILEEIGSEHRTSKFAIIIDEAHSSQGGKVMAQMHMALAENGGENEEETYEDIINRIMESRKMLPNASYFAFTATPKNKTLEIFVEARPPSGCGPVCSFSQLHHEAGHTGTFHH